MSRYFIGLGSNVGDRLDHLAGACRRIRERGYGLQASSIYETEPVGGPEQDPYLNAVIAVDADLDPPEMLDLLQRVEADHGRERTVRWGPRTLDLDIVAWDGPPYRDDRLTIPHPRAGERAFVLIPLAQFWPTTDVGGGKTAADALATIDRSGVERLATHWIPPVSHLRANLLVAGQMVLIGLAGLAIAMDGGLPTGLSATSILGGVLMVAGVWLMLASARLLGPAMTASPLPRVGASLVERGPYRLVRHPIYTGVCLTVIGAAVLFASATALVAALALVPYLWLKTLYEERQLRMRFAGYRAYQTRVRWRLIPFVT